MSNMQLNDILNESKILDNEYENAGINRNANLQRFIVNHLLILVYTFYEQSIKEIVRDILKKYKHDKEKSFPVTFEVKYDSDTYVPKLKKSEIFNQFPILRLWYFSEQNYNMIEAMVFARNNYAHEGSHSYTFDSLISIIPMTIKITQFVKYVYLKDKLEDTFILIQKDYELYKEFIKNHNVLIQIYSARKTLEDEKKEFYYQIFDKAKTIQDEALLIPGIINFMFVRNIDTKKRYQNSNAIMNHLSEISVSLTRTAKEYS